MEELGGLSLPITADFSGLDADFQAAISTAQSEGASLAAAIASALKMPDTAPVTEAVQSLTGPMEDVSAAARNLFLDTSQLQSPLQDLVEKFRDGEISVKEYISATNGLAEVMQASGQAAEAMGSGFGAAGTAAGGAAANVNTLGDAGHHAAEGGHEAHDSWAELGSELASMVGISLTIEGLIDLAKEALNAADAITHTTIALTTLTGSGEKAEEILVGLEELGMKDGLRMPGLRDAATQMEALLPAGTDVVEVLGHIADGAAVMGKGIEQGAQAFDRIVEGGMLSTRTLSNLGLRMDDIGAAMTELGASADVMAAGTKKAFSELDKEGRVAVVTEALQKLDGVAKKVADETFGGAWNRAANQFEKDMEGMGSAIMPMALQALPAVESAMKAVLATAVLVGTGLQVLVDGVVGLTTIALSSIKGLAQTWAEAMSGNFKGAITTATQAFDDVKAAAKFSWDSIINDSTKGAEVLAKIYATDIPRDTKAAGEGADDLTLHFNTAGEAAEKTATKFATATHAFVDITKAAAAGMLDFSTQIEKAWDKVGLLASSQEHINELLAVQKQRFDDSEISAAEYGKTLDAAKKINDELAKSLDAVNKIAKDLVAGVWSKEIKDGIDAATASLKGFVDQAVKAPQPISDVNKAMIDAGIGAGKMKTAIEDLKTPVEQLVTGMQKLVEQAQRSGDWSAVIQDLDNFDKRIQNLAKTDLPEAERQMEVFIQGMINAKAPAELVEGQLIKLQAIVEKMGKEGLPQAAEAMKGYLDLLKQVPTAVNDIISKQEQQIQNDEKAIALLSRRKDAVGATLQAEAQWYQDQIRLGELQGKNVEAYIIGAEKTKLAIEANRLATHGLADEYVHMIDDVVKGFDQMGSVMADAIVNGKNLGDALIGQFKKIGQSILSDLINAALLPLKQEFMHLISTLLPGVTQGLKVSTDGIGSLSSAATAGAAAQGAHTAATVANTSATVASAAGLAALGVSAQLAAIQIQLAAIQMNTLIGAIAGIVGAIAGIVGDIYLAAIDTKLFHLNTAALSIFNETVNARKDAWDQFNQNFIRFGEMKNALDSIAASIETLSKAAPVAAATNTQAALEKIASTGDLQLAQLASIADSAKWSLAALNLIAGSTRQIADTLAFAIHDDLSNVNQRLDAIIGALLYGNNTNSQASRAQMDSFSSFAQSANQVGHGIIGAIGVDAAENARGADAEIAMAQDARTAAARAYASATSLQGQLAALQAQVAADNQLAAALERSGNATLAQTYRQEAAMLQQDVRALIPQIGSVVSSTQNVALMVGQLDLNSGAYISSSTTQIVGAVYGAASIVAGAVGAAVAAGGYATSGGTTTRVPPKGTQTNVPSGESQLPGNSNSPTGNTGQQGGVPPNGAGGQRIPLPPIDYGPPAQNPYGNYSTTNNTVPFDPLNPFTWSSNMSQAQQDAINRSHVPSFDQGGIQSRDMLSLVHKDEMVLPPDISLMLQSMATTPALPGRVPNYGGSPSARGDIGGTVINMPVTFNGVTDAKQLMDMWTQRVKLLIPRATVFSGA